MLSYLHFYLVVNNQRRYLPISFIVNNNHYMMSVTFCQILAIGLIYASLVNRLVFYISIKNINFNLCRSLCEMHLFIYRYPFR